MAILGFYQPGIAFFYMQELTYTRYGDCFVPNINLPKESRSIGRWGRMHREYIKEHRPVLYNQLCLSGELWTYLVDLNEQAQNHLECIVEQMKCIEGVTEELKQHDQIAWIGMMNNICSRAEEIVKSELIYN